MHLTASQWALPGLFRNSESVEMMNMMLGQVAMAAYMRLSNACGMGSFACALLQ